jgi:hypothetical protein
VTQQDLEERMLSGEPFTYGALCEWRAEREQGAVRTKNYDHDRLVDRTIQKLRRAGKISFTREGGKVVWRPAAEPRPSEAAQVEG